MPSDLAAAATRADPRVHYTLQIRFVMARAWSSRKLLIVQELSQHYRICITNCRETCVVSECIMVIVRQSECAARARGRDECNRLWVLKKSLRLAGEI